MKLIKKEKKVVKPTKKKEVEIKEDVRISNQVIVETGNVNQGKKEYKNIETGQTYYE